MAGRWAVRGAQPADGNLIVSEHKEAGVTRTVIPAVVDNGEWAACFGLSWTGLWMYDAGSSGKIVRPGGMYLRKVAGTMGVAAGRNEIVRGFLSTDADYLFMIDADMGFDPDTVDRMVASLEMNGADVLGALCFAQKQDTDMAPAPFYGNRFRIQPTLYAYTEIPETGERGFRSITKYQRDGYQAVGATGAACLLIPRRVLEALPEDPFTPVTVDGAGGNGTKRTFSEDLSFCIHVSGAGFEIGVDTSIKTTHHKGGIYLDETQFVMQQETLVQAKGHEIARNAALLAGARR